MPSPYLLLPLVVLTFFIHRLLKRSSIANIPGPRSPSFLYGNLVELLLPHTYGEHEFAWQATYGGLYRIKGPFSSDRLIVSDPAAFKSVLNDTSVWKRSEPQQYSVDMLIGKKAVFYVDGEDHKRIRNVMNTAFSPGVIRGLPPIFKKVAEKIAIRWEDMLTSNAQIDASGAIDIYPSLHDATLDAVGEGAMGYEFHSLENSDSELGASHRNIIALSGVRSPLHILADYLVPFIPVSLLSLATNLPTAAFNTLRKNRALAKGVSEELIKGMMEVVGQGETRKDLTYSLVKANSSSKSAMKMSVEEMEQQIPSLMIAGQDTTGNTLSWALYRLASSPAIQQKIREEVTEAYESSPGGDISLSTIEGMEYLNAFLKETLRLHPGLPMSDRVAAADTVIPLSQPIITTDGEKITEVKVTKGTLVHVATASYNRLSSVWGPDSHEFKPERWLQPGTSKTASSFGPFANLATFFGGPRVCIGWRFAVTELQVLFTEIVRRFKFSLPPASISPDLQVRMSVAVNMIPVTPDGKPSLPIVIEAI